MTFVVKVGTSPVTLRYPTGEPAFLNEFLVRRLAADVTRTQVQTKNQCIVVTSGAKMAGKFLVKAVDPRFALFAEGLRNFHRLNETLPVDELQLQRYLWINFGNWLLGGTWEKGFRDSPNPCRGLLMLDIGAERYTRFCAPDAEMIERVKKEPWNIQKCLAEGIIPLVNGNDYESPTPLNNDQIAVDLAVNHKARMLLLLTDVAGVLERRKWWWGMKRMETIKRSEIPAVQAALADARGAKGAVVGTGGMAEKLRQAARVSPETTVVIASAKIPRVIERVVHEEDRRIGTWIVPG